MQWDTPVFAVLGVEKAYLLRLKIDLPPGQIERLTQSRPGIEQKNDERAHVRRTGSDKPLGFGGRNDAILKWYADCEGVKAKNPKLTSYLDLARYLSRHHPDYKGKFKTEKSLRHLTKRIGDAYNPKKTSGYATQRCRIRN